MITDLAQGEIDRLGDMGITLSPDEIVTLNAFSVDALRRKDGWKFIPQERRVRFGNICFREPTLGHLKYIEDCKDFIDLDGESGFLFRSWVCSRNVDQLPDCHDEESVKSSMFEFLNVLKNITPRLLQMIIQYVFLGPYGLPKLDELENNDELEEDARDWVLEIVADGMSFCSGITFDQALKMRSAEINSISIRTALSTRAIEIKGAMNQFFKYVSDLEEKHSAEKK